MTPRGPRTADRTPRAGAARLRAALAGTRATGTIALNSAALIDIVFLLLVYFLLIAEFRRDELGFAIIPASPAAQHTSADPFALPEPPITIRIEPADVLERYRLSIDSPLFRTMPRSLDELRETAATLRGDLLSNTQPFIIAPHAEADWDFTLGVLNALLLAGYERIRFEERP